MSTTIEDIIKRFELYLDDTSELSTQEELELAQRVFDSICNSNDWEILKKSASGVLSTSVPYIELPDDFAYITENANFTNNSVSYEEGLQGKIVFIGTTKTPYKVINWSDRRQYEGSTGYCYVDIANNRLYFTKQPTTADTYDFDYMSSGVDLKLTTEFPFPDRFSAVLFHGMCVDGYIIQQFDKARSYADENQLKYQNILEDMKIWNSQLLNN